MRVKISASHTKLRQVEAGRDTDAGRTELHTTRVMYRLFVGILGAVFAFGAIVAMAKAPAFWIPTSVMGAVIVIIVTWLRTTHLAFVDDEVSYSSLFVSTRLSVSEIISAKFVIGFSSLKPFQRIVFRMRRSKDEVTVNAGLFDPPQVKEWVEHLNRHLRTTT